MEDIVKIATVELITECLQEKDKESLQKKVSALYDLLEARAENIAYSALLEVIGKLKEKTKG